MDHPSFVGCRTARAAGRRRAAAGLLALAAAAVPLSIAAAAVPESIAVTDKPVVLTLQAEGVQLYQCTAAAGGATAWTFREPIASLMADGKTVGRHFAGPTWELTDGSAVTAKVTGQAPGATAADIPWLRLAVAGHAGQGALAKVGAVQRVNTRGGAYSGACPQPGAFHAEPYSADYVFFAG